MKEAVLLDPRYTFHIAGTFQEARFEIYMRHLIKEMSLENHVVFHGWVKDLPLFLEAMNYEISTSPWEGCPNNVIEAMACGTKPLIHNWPGAKQLFPANLVFNTVSEFLEKLHDEAYDSSYYREWVEIHYNAEIQVPEMDQFMHSLMQSARDAVHDRT
jgi:glycosyltransferase involved in cell wall biosynthesis